MAQEGKGEDWYKRLSQEKLTEICCYVLSAKPSDTEVRRKVDFIIRELSKLYRGRESYLEFRTLPDPDEKDGNKVVSRICFRSVDTDRQDLSFFAEELKRRPREYSPEIFRVATKIALYEKQNTNGRSEFVLVAPDSCIKGNDRQKGLCITSQPVTGNNYKVLFDQDNRMFRRRVNNELVLSYAHGTLYQGLPLSASDFRHLQQHGLAVDEKLQAVVYAILTTRCQEYDIRAAGVVVLENATGAVRSLVSYPQVNPNMLEYSKDQEIADKFRKEKIKVDRDLSSVPLTAYHMASTWKFIEAATALQIDSAFYTRKYKSSKWGSISMDKYIYQSDNDYSVALLEELLEKHPEKFFTLLGTEYGMSRKREWYPEQRPFGHFRKLKYQPATLGDYDRQLTGNSPDSLFIKNTALGQQNMESSIAGSATNFARVISGKKVIPTLFAYKETPQFEDLLEAKRMDSLKGSLNRTTLEGTASNLRRFNKSNSCDQTDKMNHLYAKTGTGDTEDTHSLIIFGTEEYTFGIFLYNRGKNKYSAAQLAADMIPSIQCLCPEYIERVKNGINKSL